MSGLRRSVSLVGLAVAALVLVVNIGFFTDAGVGLLMRNNGPYLFTLVLLLIVTSRTRTAGAFTLLTAWLFGTLATYQAFRVVGGQFADSAIQGTVWVPITEELIKAASVLLLLGLAARSHVGRPSASDGLLIGYIVGWGASVTEDASTQILRVAGFDGTPPLSWLFPFVDTDGSSYAGGHAAWAAITGGAIGIAMLLWHRNRVVVLVPVVALGLTMLDHGLGNEVFGASRLDQIDDWVRDLYGVLGDGRVAVVALLVMIVATVVVDHLALHRAFDPTDSFERIGVRQTREFARGQRWAGLPVARTVATYNRLRAAMYFAVAAGRFEGSPPERQRAAADGLLALCRSIGVPVTVMPDEVGGLQSASWSVPLPFGPPPAPRRPEPPPAGPWSAPPPPDASP